MVFLSYATVLCWGKRLREIFQWKISGPWAGIREEVGLTPLEFPGGLQYLIKEDLKITSCLGYHKEDSDPSMKSYLGELGVGCKLGSGLSLGYSLDDFDTDLTGDSCSGKGPYLKIRFKLDERMFKGGKNQILSWLKMSNVKG